MTDKRKGRPIRMNDNDMRKRIQETHDAVVGMVGKLGAVCEKVENHETILDGAPSNGKSPGLRSRMGRVEFALCILMAGVGTLVLDLIREHVFSH